MNFDDINKNTIIYDTENWHEDVINVDTAKFRFFGWYEYSTNSYKVTSDIEVVKEVISKAKVLVGLNNRAYDQPILEKLGVSFEYKIQLDLMQILKPKEDGGKGRSAIIVKDGKNMKETIDGYSMLKIGRWLKLENQKDDDFDYSVLKQEVSEMSVETKKYIYTYLKQDLITTKDIYEFLESYFGNMRAYLSDKDNYKKEYIRSTTATYAYKVVCNYTGIKEEYGDGKRIDFKGAFVLQPSKEEYKGNIYCFDFSSLYPNIFFQCNLFSQSDTGWNGGGVWTTKGTYNNVKQGKIETVLHDLFNKRLELKKAKDPAEYGIKIFMNSLYGAVASPVFKNIHNYTAAEDCTQLGQQWIKYVIEKFKEKGYEIIYSDTDSIYLKDNFSDKEKLLSVKKEVIDFIKSTLPFPNETFDLKLESEIKYLKFFVGKNGELIKKNYIYITKDDKMVIKGLQIIKSNTSNISKNIFTNYLKPQIMEKNICKFEEDYILKLIEENSNIEDLAQSFKIKSSETYEKEARLKGKEPVSGQYKLSLKFGEGRHKLLKIISDGNNEYVKPEDFKGKITDLDLSYITDTELGVFIIKNFKLSERDRNRQQKVIDEMQKKWHDEFMEYTDNLYDSKGSDISEKDFLKNEMDRVWF